MSKTKRLRVFAGPNGSGKSYLFDIFKENFNPGLFVNSDLIEKEISERGFINLDKYNLNLTEDDLQQFCESSTGKSLLEKAESLNHPIDIYIKENIIVDKSKDTHSYEVSLITSFIREKLRESTQSFSFETVMSHPSKLEEIMEAKEQGYKTYLYFICLDDPVLNLSRIANRVEKGGHDVDPEKVVTRYTRTLENLMPAIFATDRAYLFDNSDSMRLIAEAEKGKLTVWYNKENLPGWFIKYVINRV